jgi:hypothetical protein
MNPTTSILQNSRLDHCGDDGDDGGDGGGDGDGGGGDGDDGKLRVDIL